MHVARQAVPILPIPLVMDGDETSRPNNLLSLSVTSGKSTRISFDILSGKNWYVWAVKVHHMHVFAVSQQDVETAPSGSNIIASLSVLVHPVQSVNC